MTRSRPVVGIPCDRRLVEGLTVHSTGGEYIAAVMDGAEAVPLLIPATDSPLASGVILKSIDGLLLTGSASNVSPGLYDGLSPHSNTLLDEYRDRTTIPLIRAAVDAGMPVFAICRGFQELNVAFGGTLHQHVHEVPGRRDHREDETASLEVQYGPAHPVHVSEDGLLACIVAMRDFMVNSLHGQGIDRLARALHADAHAPDGQIEAVSMPGAKAFVLGVQWHPEWGWADNPISRSLFAAFGAALRS
jgi:putative glutamine amidotransferase